jgi:hypothetical protein
MLQRFIETYDAKTVSLFSSLRIGTKVSIYQRNRSAPDMVKLRVVRGGKVYWSETWAI